MLFALRSSLKLKNIKGYPNPTPRDSTNKKTLGRRTSKGTLALWRDLVAGLGSLGEGNYNKKQACDRKLRT